MRSLNRRRALALSSAALSAAAAAPAWPQEAAADERDQLVARFAALRIRDGKIADDRERLIEDQLTARITTAEQRARRAETGEANAQAEASQDSDEIAQLKAQLAQLQEQLVERTNPDLAAADKASADAIVQSYDASTVRKLLASPFLDPTAAQQFVAYFPYDQFELTPDAQSVLQQAAIVAKNVQSTHLIVVGYYDPGQEDLQMAERRAKIAADYLVQSGVSPDVIDVDWKASTASGLAGDPGARRTEVSVIFAPAPA